MDPVHRLQACLLFVFIIIFCFSFHESQMLIFRSWNSVLNLFIFKLCLYHSRNHYQDHKKMGKMYNNLNLTNRFHTFNLNFWNRHFICSLTLMNKPNVTVKREKKEDCNMIWIHMSDRKILEYTVTGSSEMCSPS